jgi:hypothetical protein
MKQGRNEPCKCGSNQKYKKCCEKGNKEIILNIPSNKIIKRQLIDIQKLTECPSDKVLLENFNNSTELKFVTSVEKLPYEIKEKVIKFSKIIKPKSGECETYSSFISLNIPEVKQVRGFFQIPYTKKHGEEFIKDKYNVKKIEYKLRTFCQIAEKLGAEQIKIKYDLQYKKEKKININLDSLSNGLSSNVKNIIRNENSIEFIFNYSISY